MVEKLRKILEKMINDKGPVTLFATLQMDELVDKWSVILSAPWAREGDTEIFTYVKNSVISQLTEEEINSVARIGIFPKNAHLIELLLEYPKDSLIEDEKVNGNLIHKAHILESNKGI